jgi:hypothetical protein
MIQLETYRQACAEANKPALGGGAATTTATGGPLLSPMGTPKGIRTTTASNTITTATTTIGGAPIKSSVMSSAAAKRGFAGPPPGVVYKNLDEAKVIATLPEPLQSLLHLRQLQKEMAATTAVRITKKNLEDHAKKIEAAYLDALNEYTGTTVEEDDDDDNNNNNNNTTTITNKKNQPPTWDKEEAYARAQSLALLYRYSSPGMEQRTISEAYQKAVDQFVALVSPTGEDNITMSV